MKLFLGCLSFFLLELLLITKSMAMIATLSLEQLIQSSDLIVIAKVIEKNSSKHEVKNILYVEEVLKGTWDKSKILVIYTGPTDFEDVPKFPEECQKALLFLKRLPSGEPQINNMLQGLMNLDNQNRLYGFGFGHNIKEIKNLIKKLANQQQKSHNCFK